MENKFRAVVTVDASIVMEFMADNTLSDSQLKDMALSLAEEPTLCHYCSGVLEIGPTLRCVEVRPVMT